MHPVSFGHAFFCALLAPTPPVPILPGYVVQVVDAELEALQVRLRTMAGEMAAKADAVVVTKIADTVDDNVQRCVPMEWLQGGGEG